MIRSQVHVELEVTYREKYLKQEEEVKEAWANVSKLRYELSFIKAEYEHDKAEHARQMQDLKLHHDLEVLATFHSQSLLSQSALIPQILMDLMSAFAVLPLCCA